MMRRLSLPIKALLFAACVMLLAGLSQLHSMERAELAPYRNSAMPVLQTDVIKPEPDTNTVALEVTPPLLTPSTPSTPLQIAIAIIAVDHDIVEYTDEMVTANSGVDPVEWDDVAWWSGGGRPGATLDNTSSSSAQDYTTYLYGHTGTNGKAVFNDIGLLENGDEVVLETDTDRFVYAVEQVFTVSKADLMSDSRAVEDTPGRLLLISCSSSNGDYDNIVVVANLVNSS